MDKKATDITCAKYPINLRRVRKNKKIRDLFSSTFIPTSALIQPYFVYEGLDHPEELKSIAGQKKHNIKSVIKEIEFALTKNISSFLLFIIPEKKIISINVNDFNFDFDCEVISKIKNIFKDEIILFTDVCLCSHTANGHCEVNANNDLTIDILTKKAVLHASAGTDVVSPSDMMDGRIKSIRIALNQNSMNDRLIMSYSSKFSSNFYGPFRAAAESTPAFGDRKSYQLDPRNIGDAIRSSMRDIDDGADILMVKPAAQYLDIIYRIKNHNNKSKDFPLAAYQVSGEYQALHLMAAANLLKFEDAYIESLISIKRAGADLIITYGATRYQEHL
ncbi:MAG: porphobilinogen synthase [Oligoflexia bacterium]|nr:porphobilinogen synthase [Oligoflexia bacterium]